MERSESVADKVVGSGPPALLGVKKHSLPFHCPGLFPKLSEPDWETFRFFLWQVPTPALVGH